ncbi:MAG: hypothetical protein GF355_06770 [Candidatus Eisenbacteria bacterium]|nr:hypothetical protein [Candidatus Eisenbacteria bacterium]
MRVSIMHDSIMRFLDREEEFRRLDRLARRRRGGLVVVYGRRRIGKTRLLLEWVRNHDGLYTVADQSAAAVQIRYAAQAIAVRFPGFADVDYPDWGSLLARLSREAKAIGWRGPIVFDELPYLVAASPELPSVLQRWIDHSAGESNVLVAVAGSSQRMMQGLVLPGNAPLYGRASEILELKPLAPSFLRNALGLKSGAAVAEEFAAWGGVPRYWELAETTSGPTPARVEELVLDPGGPLHREPDRILIEEIPPAAEVRPVLDAIGSGAHRVSEIGSRVGRPATSMSRPLERLIEMGLVRREVPFGEPERKSRRSLYKIDDPFFRLWFRTVAPHRGFLGNSTKTGRARLLRRYWANLISQAWEDICRARLVHLAGNRGLGKLGPWMPGMRWWRGREPEWDVVSVNLDGNRLLLGESKWSAKPLAPERAASAVTNLLAREPPSIPLRRESETIRALFVPEVEKTVPRRDRGVRIVTGEDLLG